jgi:hypothetical protein
MVEKVYGWNIYQIILFEGKSLTDSIFEAYFKTYENNG